MTSSAQQDERRPLLQGSLTRGEHDGAPSRSVDGTTGPWGRLLQLLPFLLMFTAVEVGASLLSIAESQIIEGVVCRKYYPDVFESSADPRCKNEDVQSELSMLQGWELPFALVPGLLTTIPYGIVADKYGRKLVLILSLIGVALSQFVDLVVCRFPDTFDIRLIWLGASMSVVGGGPFVFTAMMFTMASDISTEAQRSTTFFHLTAMAIAGQLVAAPLAFVAMARGEWFAASVGFLCVPIAILVAIASPETQRKGSAVHGENTPQEDLSGTVNGKSSITWRALRPKISNAVREAFGSIRCLFWENKRLGLLLLTFLFTTLGRYVSIIQMQYVTKRFSWSWSQAGLLSSITAGMNLILVVSILPFASRVLLGKMQLSPLFKDLWIARASIVALVAGSFGIGIANQSVLLLFSLAIYSLGAGYTPAMRSLLALVAEDQHVGMLFTALSVLENFGNLIAGPLMATTFRIGLSWGEPWIGLPFIAAACLLACGAAIVFGVSFSRKDDKSKVVDDQDEAA